LIGDLLPDLIFPDTVAGFDVPIVYGTAEHWLARAQEAREMAAQMNDPVARQAMLAVADGYESVAKRAEARAAAVHNAQLPQAERVSPWRVVLG
jgi:hypothetical protein